MSQTSFNGTISIDRKSFAWKDVGFVYWPVVLVTSLTRAYFSSQFVPNPSATSVAHTCTFYPETNATENLKMNFLSLLPNQTNVGLIDVTICPKLNWLVIPTWAIYEPQTNMTRRSNKRGETATYFVDVLVRFDQIHAELAQWSCTWIAKGGWNFAVGILCCDNAGPIHNCFILVFRCASHWIAHTAFTFCHCGISTEASCIWALLKVERNARGVDFQVVISHD